jgi:hypothetical protein
MGQWWSRSGIDMRRHRQLVNDRITEKEIRSLHARFHAHADRSVEPPIIDAAAFANYVKALDVFRNVDPHETFGFLFRAYVACNPPPAEMVELHPAVVVLPAPAQRQADATDPAAADADAAALGHGTTAAAQVEAGRTAGTGVPDKAAEPDANAVPAQPASDVLGETDEAPPMPPVEAAGPVDADPVDAAEPTENTAAAAEGGAPGAAELGMLAVRPGITFEGFLAYHELAICGHEEAHRHRSCRVLFSIFVADDADDRAVAPLRAVARAMRSNARLCATNLAAIPAAELDAAVTAAAAALVRRVRRAVGEDTDQHVRRRRRHTALPDDTAEVEDPADGAPLPDDTELSLADLITAVDRFPAILDDLRLIV